MVDWRSWRDMLFLQTLEANSTLRLPISRFKSCSNVVAGRLPLTST